MGGGHMTLTKAKQQIKNTLAQPWLQAMLPVLCIPLFSEFLAPVLAMAAVVLAWRAAVREGRTVSVGAAGKALLVYIIYQAVTVLFSETPLPSGESLLLWVTMYCAYLALATVVTDRTRLDTTLYALALVTGVVGLIGCVQYFLRFIGADTPLQLWEPVDRFVYSFFPMEINLDVVGTRVSSTFSNPNILGQYLVMAVPFVAYYAFHGSDKRRCTLCRFCLLAAIGCAAFTFSRGTYLALLVVALVLIITNLHSIVTILLSLFSALLLIPDTVWNRLMSVGRLDASSLERLHVWQICLGLIAKRPLFGYGSGIQYTWSVMEANGINAPHAHNLVLQVLVEGGIVGLCLMLFLGFRTVHTAFNLASRRESRWMGTTLIAFILGFGTNVMVEYGFSFPKLMGVFALILALTDAASAIHLGRLTVPLGEALAPARLWEHGRQTQRK